MIIYNLTTELNRTFLTAVTETEVYNDYRYKMLTDNCIEGILPLEMRNVNGECKIYYDISEKESFIRNLMRRDLNLSDLLLLTENMMRVSGKMREYLLEESSIVFEPDLIFLNTKTGKYEFISIPGHLRNEEEKREDLINLLQNIISHVNPEDEDAVEASYAIYEMAVSGPVLAKTLYETVKSYDRQVIDRTYEDEVCEEEEDLPEEEYEDVPKNIRYKPSLIEWLSMGFAAAGFLCIGIWTYFDLIA